MGHILGMSSAWPCTAPKKHPKKPCCSYIIHSISLGMCHSTFDASIDNIPVQLNRSFTRQS